MPNKEDRRPRTVHRIAAVAVAAIVVVLFVFLVKPPSGQPEAVDSAPSAMPSFAPAPSVQPEVFGARHLLVQYVGSQRAPVDLKRTKEEAKQRAEEAAAKAKKLVGAQKDDDARANVFAEVVKEYSDEPGGAERGGDLGRFRRGGIDPAFGAAVVKMKRGEVSGVVETPFGYHVILRTY